MPLLPMHQRIYRRFKGFFIEKIVVIVLPFFFFVGLGAFLSRGVEFLGF